MKFLYFFFFLIIILGCSKPQKNEDISFITKSYQNSIVTSYGSLVNCHNMFEEEFTKRYESFIIHYNKYKIISKISNRFYKKVNAFYHREEISQPEIEGLIKSYHAAFDSIKLFYTLNKYEKLITIDEDYHLKNKPSEYNKLFALILKSDLILNELKVLRSVYLDYDNGCGFTINYVHCDIETYNSKNYLDIKLVEHIKDSKEEEVIIDSIKSNNTIVLNYKNLIKRDSVNNTIQFIPNKKGCYSIYGELKVRGATGYKLYPFKHEFFIEKIR